MYIRRNFIHNAPKLVSNAQIINGQAMAHPFSEIVSINEKE